LTSKGGDAVAAPTPSFNFLTGHRDDGLVRIIHPTTNALESFAVFDSWQPDGIRLNWTTVSSAWKVVVVLIGGTGVSNVHVNTFATSTTTDVATSITAPGFQPDFVLCVANGGTAVNNSADTGSLNYGVSVRGGNQRSIQTAMHATNNPTICYGYASSQYVVREVEGAWGIEINNYASNGFDVVPRVGGSGTAWQSAYMAVKLNGLSASLVAYDSPTSAGSYSVSGAGFTPQFAMEVVSGLQATDSAVSSSATAEHLGVGLVAQTTACALGRISDDGVGTTNTAGVISNSNAIHLVKNGSDWQAETFTAWTGDGMTKNAVTHQAAARKRMAFFVQAPATSKESIGRGLLRGVLRGGR
jgi:hypothetical protein